MFRQVMGAAAPSTAADEVYRRLVLLQTYLLRYGKGTTKDFRRMLFGNNEKLELIILRYSRMMEGVPVQSSKFKKLSREFATAILEVRADAWEQVAEFTVEQLFTVAESVQTGTVGMVEGALPVVIGLQALPVSVLLSIVQSTPFEGRTLSQWLANNKYVDVERIVRNAKIGMVRGETAEQIARRVIGSSGYQYKDGQLTKAVRDMEAVYLTALNGIGNEVRSQLFAKNSDIVKEEVFVATLDDRTTLVCAGNDGKTFPVGEGPIPPLHFRCRSLRTVVFNADNLASRAAVPATQKMLLAEFAEKNNLGGIKAYDDLPRGFKTKYNDFARKRLRELIGQVPATTNFDSWLRNQSKAFQDEYLGKAKAEIFREGNITLDKFVTRDGYELTIEQLKQLSKRMGA